MTLQIKWRPILSENIKIDKSTRQGGLALPYLFNVFYKDLVDNLNNHEDRLYIGKNCYKVFCYADDLLLTSATTTGLQSLINVANEYNI